MTALAPFVQIVARGPGRGRAMTMDEACAAMRLIVSGAADPHAVGALLMVLRLRGETADEIAGFARGLRDAWPVLPAVDLDWPTYAAGRTRGLPWFLLAARLVALTGARVLVHGTTDTTAAGIATATGPADAARLIDRDGIACLPLAALSPPAQALLSLRGVLGLRSCINTVLRVMNPATAPAQLQGVFHPPYRALQQAAGALLGQPQLAILKGGGGEFERHPGKDAVLYRLVAGAPSELALPALMDDPRRLSDGPTDPALLAALWSGAWDDPFARTTVTGTAALALLTLGAADTPAAAQGLACDLWAARPRLSSAA
ncbi:MAG: glycosyl transferase family protein [Rhodobacteraceae bacterium]|jgi:anthranilate phosphoribosyltransferase|nr:glycosyl transferase family protein [Paracoccaceae bacterium]